MITYEKVLVLKNNPLFEKASELALSDLTLSAVEQTLKAGEILIRENQDNDALYIVLSGLLKMCDGKKVLAEFGPRQMIGDTTVLSPAPLPGVVMAAEKSVILKLTADQLYDVMSLHPTLAKAFLGNLSHRLYIAQKNQ